MSKTNDIVKVVYKSAQTTQHDKPCIIALGLLQDSNTVVPFHPPSRRWRTKRTDKAIVLGIVKLEMRLTTKYGCIPAWRMEITDEWVDEACAREGVGDLDYRLGSVRTSPLDRNCYNRSGIGMNYVDTINEAVAHYAHISTLLPVKAGYKDANQLSSFAEQQMAMYNRSRNLLKRP